MRSWIVACWMCVLPASVWAADLLEVYEAALGYDARFTAARAEYLAGQEKRIQGRAGLLPGVGVSASSSWNQTDSRMSGVSGSADYNSNNYTVQLTQPLFRWQNWVQYKQGELQTLLADVQLGTARQDLILRVAKAYFDVLNAQDDLAAIVELRTAAAEQYALAQKSFEVGTVTVTDVYESLSRLDLATAQEIAAQNTLSVQREALGVIIGSVPDSLAGLKRGLALMPPKEMLPAWVTAAEESSYTVQSSQLAREIAVREVERARAGHLPTVDVVASHGTNNRMSVGVDRYEVTAIGVQVNVPLYAGGGTESQVREAAALKSKADALLDDARRAAAQAARESYLGVTSGIVRVKALEAAEKSSALSVEANKVGYEVGARINIDVLNAQSQLADTQKQLANARYTALTAQLQLKAAAGILAEEDVRQLNALLLSEKKTEGVLRPTP